MLQFRDFFWWAIAIYAVMHLLWSGFILYGLAGTTLAWILSVSVLVLLCSYAGLSLHRPNWRDVIPYSVFWALGTVFFDLIFSVPLSGWVVYTETGVWMGYILVAVVPVLAVRLLKSHGVV